METKVKKVLQEAWVSSSLIQGLAWSVSPFAGASLTPTWTIGAAPWWVWSPSTPRVFAWAPRAREILPPRGPSPHSQTWTCRYKTTTGSNPSWSSRRTNGKLKNGVMWRSQISHYLIKEVSESIRTMTFSTIVLLALVSLASAAFIPYNILRVHRTATQKEIKTVIS